MLFSLVADYRSRIFASDYRKCSADLKEEGQRGEKAFSSLKNRD